MDLVTHGALAAAAAPEVLVIPLLERVELVYYTMVLVTPAAAVAVIMVQLPV
jgi:hypothetical protein